MNLTIYRMSGERLYLSLILVFSIRDLGAITLNTFIYLCFNEINTFIWRKIIKIVLIVLEF